MSFRDLTDEEIENDLLPHDDAPTEGLGAPARNAWHEIPCVFMECDDHARVPLVIGGDVTFCYRHDPRVVYPPEELAPAISVSVEHLLMRHCRGNR